MRWDRLRAITFLAPNMLPVHRYLMDALGRALGCAVELKVGQDYTEVLQADLAFICGLPYVLYREAHAAAPAFEALVAPVLRGERFQNRPIYFSDVIVHRDSPFQTFADLRGCSWAYNEPLSQSGYGITRYTLLMRGEITRFFSRVVQTGFHQRSIRMVATREVDASAVDVQVLAIELREHPQYGERLRVIDSFGPSTIQPLVAAAHLPDGLKRDIQVILTELHRDPTSRPFLDKGMIDHYAAVSDADYDDIRHMRSACEQAGFMALE